MAHAYCSEPSKPSCLSYLDEKSEKYDIEFCRDDVERYQTQMRAYVECVNESAVEEIRKAVRQYNCIARREGYCF